jgi:16S rRNA (guanine527-N7)-methyltransferase
MKIRQKPEGEIWEVFSERAKPTERQLEQFQEYADYLLEQNALFNMTAINDLLGIAKTHFQDSLALGGAIDLKKVSMIADIGAGAGFPGIPLKIMNPHISLVLIVVNKKKQEFLRQVAERLGLENVTVVDLDWRTFLRKTEFPIDFFVTRAAIGGEELIRAFKPSCIYQNTKIVYWATKIWEAEPKAQAFVESVYPYKQSYKERKLVFLAKPKASGLNHQTPLI